MTITSGAKFIFKVGVLFLCLATPGLALAQEPAKPADPAPDPDKVTLNFFKGTEVGGLVDAYYLWNSNKNGPAYHAFDSFHNSFDLSMAEVWLAKPAASDSPIGYKIRLNFGHATSIYTPGTDGDYKNVEEAYGTYLAPVGKGLQFDIGKFVTNAGAEVVEAKDNWNYSRGLLFQLAIPVYHAGIRVTYSPNDKVTLMGGVINGWNNVNDQNTGKSVMASVTFKPTGALTLIENYIGGAEQPQSVVIAGSQPWRTLSDTVVSFTATPMVTLMANYDYGRDTLPGGLAGVVNTWQGIAGYVKFQPTKTFAFVPRIEFFKDADGFATGVAQNLTSATLTLELKPADNFMWRIEYRGDFSNNTPGPFTSSTGAPQKNQNMLILGFLYSFSSKS